MTTPTKKERFRSVAGETSHLRRQVSLGLKILLSLWLCYHLLCIVILPNGGSFFGRYFEKYILTYANAIGVNNTWNFYSPDPANAMYFSYTVHFEDSNGEELKPSIQEYLPPQKDQIVTNSSERRLLYAMRFLALDPRRLQVLMAPWICREYEGASRINISHVIERIPLLDTVVSRMNERVEDLREHQESAGFEYDCRNKPDEVSL